MLILGVLRLVRFLGSQQDAGLLYRKRARRFQMNGMRSDWKGAIDSAIDS